MMKTLPDKSIDLFLLDLPYGCLSSQKNNCGWDIKLNLEELWSEIERLMKDDHTPIIHFCNLRFGMELVKSKEKWFRYDLVWDKVKPVGFLSVNKQPMRRHENIFVFSKKSPRYYRKDIEGEYPNTKRGRGLKESNVYGDVHKEKYYKPDTSTTHRCATSVIEVQNKQIKGRHPTEKPLELYTFLLERYSKEGDTVLDPTFGSGNSGLASKQLNRDYIGIEKNEEFYKKASELLCV